MLFNTLNQGYIFLIFIYYGIITGFLFLFFYKFVKKIYPTNLKQYFLTKVKNTKNLKITKKQKINKILYNLFLNLLIILICFIFYLIIYLYNWGQIRVFCILAFVLGIVFSKIIVLGIKKLIIKIKIKKLLNK